MRLALIYNVEQDFTRLTDGIPGSGLPIHQLVIATNENDILNRFFRTGVYERKGVLPTLAPAMDIQISSNFERYLWYLVHKWRALNFDAESEAMRVAATSQTVRQWMEQVSTAGRMSVLEEMAKDGRASIFDLARGDFTSMRVSNEEILVGLRLWRVSVINVLHNDTIPTQEHYSKVPPWPRHRSKRSRRPKNDTGSSYCDWRQGC